MLNLEKKIKLLLLSILAIIAAILIFILINSVISKPVIETFNELKIPRMTLNLTDSKSIEAENKIKAVEIEFEYKIIGFIAGDCRLISGSKKRKQRTGCCKGSKVRWKVYFDER